MGCVGEDAPCRHLLTCVFVRPECPTNGPKSKAFPWAAADPGKVFRADGSPAPGGLEEGPGGTGAPIWVPVKDPSRVSTSRHFPSRVRPTTGRAFAYSRRERPCE